MRSLFLKIPGVDVVEARLLDRETQKSAARSDDSSGCIWTHVVLGQKPHTVCSNSLDGSHTRNISQPLHKALSFRFQFEMEAAAQDLMAELRYRSNKDDAALIEQRDAVANALHALKHVRRQQHARILVPEVANDFEQLERRLRITRPEVGSSRKAICASFIKISATPSRCRIPCEKVATCLSATSASPACASAVLIRISRSAA